MRTIEQRLARLERLWSEKLFSAPGPVKRTLTEKEACEKYGVTKSRLKQLRLGNQGKPPVLKKWTTSRGRRPQYDAAELERYFNKELRAEA